MLPILAGLGQTVQSSLSPDNDFHLVAESVGLSARSDRMAMSPSVFSSASRRIRLAGRGARTPPALWLSFAFYLACALVGGTAHRLKNVMYRSLIHTDVPENLNGRFRRPTCAATAKAGGCGNRNGLSTQSTHLNGEPWPTR